jgi:hypothetical protein
MRRVKMTLQVTFMANVDSQGEAYRQAEALRDMVSGNLQDLIPNRKPHVEMSYADSRPYYEVTSDAEHRKDVLVMRKSSV